MLAFFAFIAAMFISMLLIPPLMRSAQRYALVDVPSARKVHDIPIPRIGGLAMVAGAVTPILLWVDQSRFVLAYLWGVAVIIVFGMWDDRSSLDYRGKFIGQLIAVLIVVWYGNVVIYYVPFGGIDPIPHAPAFALSVFALLGVTNAINLADGLDGLAGGTTLLSIGMLALLAFMAGDHDLVLLAMAVMGAIVGFLRFNTHPAQVFMGDAGSQFLGFSAGVLVIVLTQQASPILSPAMALLLLGLPLIDTFLVMGQRVIEGRSPFRPDRNHIHHKLLKLGLDHYEAVVVIYALQASLVSLAFLCRFQSDLLNMGIFLGVLGALAIGFGAAGHYGWRLRGTDATAPESAVRRFAGRLKRSALLTRVPTLFAAFSIPVFALFVVLELERVPSDGRLTSLVLWAGLMLAAVWRRGSTELALVERLLLYVALTTVVYYWCGGRGSDPGLLSLETGYFAALGVSVLIAYRFGHNRSFNVTPTDFLIIIIAVLVPTLTRTLFPHTLVGEIAIKTLVLFYALELVLAEWRDRLWRVRAGACVVLTVFALRLTFGDVAVAG